MNLIILLSIVAWSSGAKLNKGYLPPEHAKTSGGSEFLETPVVVADDVVFQKTNSGIDNLNINQQQSINGIVQIGNYANSIVKNHEDYTRASFQGQSVTIIGEEPERTQANLERNAAILRQDFVNNGDSYAYAFETENGIYGEENGVATNGVIAQGGFSYIGDDGIQYSIRYTADENGFQPHGDHLPTPPPIPEEILRSLEQNARDEAAGIFDDGSYNEDKYGDRNEYNNFNLGKELNGLVINNHEQVLSDQDTIVTNAAILPKYTFNGQQDLKTIVVNDAVPIAINNAYLPPNAVIEDRSSQNELLVQRNDNNSNKNLYFRKVNKEIDDSVNKSYLPPIKQGIEDRSSQNGQFVFGSRTHKPSYSSKKGYQY